MKLMLRMTRLIVQLRRDPDAGVRWAFQDRDDWLKSSLHGCDSRCSAGRSWARRCRFRDPSSGVFPYRYSSQWGTAIRSSDLRAPILRRAREVLT
jgi:hypothetical protein